MTVPIFVSNIDSVADNGDLPRPETAFGTGSVLPRPMPNVNDTGRISFGAACRLPITK